MKLAIYGAGGLGKEIYDLAQRNKKFTEIFFVDDKNITSVYQGAQVFKFEKVKYNKNIVFAIATGEPFVRKLLKEKIQAKGFSLAAIVDSTAIVSPTAKLLQGVLVGAHCFISSDATIKENTFIQQLSTIGHDTIIGADCTISSLCQISGGCHVGDICYIGTGSCVREKVSVGESSIIGMGSFVHKNVKANTVEFGNPSKYIRDNVTKRVFNV